MDLEAVTQTVATLLATGAIQGMGEDSGRLIIGRIRDQVRKTFAKDQQSIATLEAAELSPNIDQYRRDLAIALTIHARQNHAFLEELQDWARSYGAHESRVIQNIAPGRDAYVAARDLKITREPRDDI